MSILKKARSILAAGFQFHIHNLTVEIRFSKCVDFENPKYNLLNHLNVQQVTFLQNKFPYLADFRFQASKENAKEILDLFYFIISINEPSSKDVALRNALLSLHNKTVDQEVKKVTKYEIAKSNLRHGLPDRAGELSASPEYASLLKEERLQYDECYGAPILSVDWGEPSRGIALCRFFEKHEELLRGKSVLHISPESELEEWIRKSNLCGNYQTSNIFGADVDMNQDLTSITLGDCSFDLIICHRVLEHVLDDTAAISELCRILKPRGMLQISVPQSMHLSKTLEWIIPDKTHHDHVRHYGRDFIGRLRSGGFLVEEESWLLNQEVSILKAWGGLPLRMYHATKVE